MRSKRIEYLQRTLKESHKKYRVASLKLRKCQTISKACSRDGYTPLFIHNIKIGDYINNCRTINKEIKEITKELKDYINFEKHKEY